MKKFKKIGIIIASVLLLAVVLFIIFTQPLVYDIKPDPIVYNKDITNLKQRPFIVDKDEYPFKSNWFERDGVSMHYIDEGEGIPIVLCHGNPEWSFIYRDLIKELSGECRLIAYDLPGFGFSDTPDDFGFTPQEHAEWIEALLIDHLKLDKFIIVVQDWGGPTGLSVATDYPERVLGTVISNSTPELFSKIMGTDMVQRLAINKNAVATTVVQMFLSEEDKNNKIITDAYRLPFPTPESRKGPAEFPKQIVLAGDWLEELENKLNLLSDKPVELIFGLKDEVVCTPEIMERWQSHFPKATVQELPEANHFTQEDSPESFGTSIRRILKQVELNK